MDWENLPTVKDETGKKFNQVLTVTDRESKQVILIPRLWKDKAPVVLFHFHIKSYAIEDYHPALYLTGTRNLQVSYVEICAISCRSRQE